MSTAKKRSFAVRKAQESKPLPSPLLAPRAKQNPKELIDAFWAGFEDPAQGAPTLDQTPPWVDVVTLAFGGTFDNNTLTTSYLCKYYPAKQIQAWVKTLQARGQKVLLSILDNDTHMWHEVNIPKFVANAVPVIRDTWGLDGVDIDSESADATSDDFIQVVTEFRKALGPKGSPGAIITYDTFAFSKWDKRILKGIVSQLDWVNLMAYFRLYDSMISLFQDYSTIVPPELLTIGVKPGTGVLDQATKLDEVKKLSAYEPPGTRKFGMMLYSLSIDTPHYTGKPTFTWTKAIHDNLTPPSSSTKRKTYANKK